MNKHLYVHLPMIYTHLLIHNAYNIYPYIMHTFLIELKFLGVLFMLLSSNKLKAVSVMATHMHTQFSLLQE